MRPITNEDVVKYVEENIGTFHTTRIESIRTIKLNKVLSRKNPYLYKAKNLVSAEQVVRTIVDAHVSSAEETILGNWLEGLAIFINEIVYGGYKSGISGMDLEFTRDSIRYLVVIKSGPNWANSKQKKELIESFNSAKRTLRTSGANINVRAINGCCYGKDNTDSGSYEKVCGQKFWELISDNPNLYIEIIEPLGHKAQERNDEYMVQYGAALTRLTAEFTNEFCHPDFTIDWAKITRLTSEVKPVKVPKVKVASSNPRKKKP